MNHDLKGNLRLEASLLALAQVLADLVALAKDEQVVARKEKVIEIDALRPSQRIL